MTREEAIKFANCLKNNYTIDFNDMADFCDMAIKALEQEPKRGHWIVNKEKDTICCSCCHDKQKIGKDEVELLDTAFTGFRFCKYCGSDNREVEDE